MMKTCFTTPGETISKNSWGQILQELTTDTSKLEMVNIFIGTCRLSRVLKIDIKSYKWFKSEEAAYPHTNFLCRIVNEIS